MQSMVEIVNKAGCYGLLVDDMTDIAVLEQMVGFIQFFNHDTGRVQTGFLFMENLLEDSDSADSQTLFDVLCKTLAELKLSLQDMKGFVSDGASVMVGKNNGLAARLKRVNATIVSVHCICHRLALACTDTNASLNYINNVETMVTQLWKLFEYSPKKMAVYLKTQTEMKKIKLTSQTSRKTVAKKLKKACKTRWLSFESAVNSIYDEIVPVLRALEELQSDAVSFGLFKKMRTVKFIGAIYILREVLPVLAQLSKAFQRDTINYAHLEPLIKYTKDKLSDILDNGSPIEQLKIGLSDGGRLSSLDLNCTDHDESQLKSLMTKYITSLKENIDNRLGQSAPILSAFSIFDPTAMPTQDSPEFKTYGETAICVLAAHVFPSEGATMCDKLIAEWGKMKYDILSWKKDVPAVLPHTTPTEWCASRVVRMKSSFGYVYPELVQIAQILLSIPVSNAWPERGVSKVRLLKTRLRSQLKNDVMNALLHITLNGPELHSPDCDSLIHEAVRQWLALKKRRKLPKTGDASSNSASTEASANTESHTEMADASVQTEQIPITITLDEIQAEVQTALKLLDLGEFDDYDSDSDTEYSDTMSPFDLNILCDT
ncbi:zinc finger protein 862-like [Ptychodera flava]|uniref:zinc finger protein 862-like n=1 Tax=Ptychodera flava TaxID=63121 RepID=UPI00396AA267